MLRDWEQYAPATALLEPMLYPDRKPLIIAVDGWPGVGKTTLCRFLSWRFNVTIVEADQFLVPRRGRLVYRLKHVAELIRGRGKVPLFIESVAVLKLLRKLKLDHNILIYVTNNAVAEIDAASSLGPELLAYDDKYRPQHVANLVLNLKAEPHIGSLEARQIAG
jgi:hypothetical protein